MRRGVAFFLIISLGVFPVRPVPAEEPEGELSLSALLEEALRLNPRLRQAQGRWEAALAKIPMAKGLAAPRIGVEFEKIPKGTFQPDRASRMFQLIQSFPFPGKLSARQQVAVKEAQVAAMEFKQAQWEVASMLKGGYYDLFLIDRETAIQEEQLLWLEQAVAVAQARYAAGQAPQHELLRLQAEALEAANAVEVFTHRRLATAAHLNHLLSRSEDEPVGRPEPIPLTEVPGSPETLLETALTHQPDLLAFQYAAERAEAALKLSKRELLPDVETMLELRDPAAGPVGPWDLTVGLVLPFWFWTKQKYGVKAALHDSESARAAHQEMRNQIAMRIHEHWHTAQAAYETASLCQEGLLPLARQEVASALAAYQGGQGSFLEVLGALRNLAQRQRSYYEHLVLLEQHLVLLEQSVGVPLRVQHRVAVQGGSS